MLPKICKHWIINTIKIQTWHLLKWWWHSIRNATQFPKQITSPRTTATTPENQSTTITITTLQTQSLIRTIITQRLSANMQKIRRVRKRWAKLSSLMKMSELTMFLKSLLGIKIRKSQVCSQMKGIRTSINSRKQQRTRETKSQSHFSRKMFSLSKNET